jgi:hypothetical protein
MALVEQLAGLDVKLGPGLADERFQILYVDGDSFRRLSAACEVLAACAGIGCALGLRRADAFRLAAATCLVFHVGNAVLRGCLEPRPEWPDSNGTAFNMASRQLLTVNAVVCKHLHPGLAPDLAAAFGKTAGQPATMLPWVVNVSEALLLPRRAPNEAVTAGACVYGHVCVRSVEYLTRVRWVVGVRLAACFGCGWLAANARTAGDECANCYRQLPCAPPVLCRSFHHD